MSLNPLLLPISWKDVSEDVSRSTESAEEPFLEGTQT